MTTAQHLGPSVLSAPLAAIDRRSLSQAWYSALHLAHAAPGAAVVQRARATAAPCEHRPRAAVARDASRCAQPAPPASRGEAASRSRLFAGAERRSPRCPLARSIEHAVLRRSSSRSSASYSIGDGAGRVIVALHTSGERMRLIAFCSPSARAAVARALEQARYALAARGIALHAAVAGERPCS